MDFPILGTEPFVVEFANTLYGRPGEQIDFLRTAGQIDAWFTLVSWPADRPSSLARDAGRLRALRDAVHELLSCAADAGRPQRSAIERVNGFAAAAPTLLRLDWPPGWVPSSRTLDVAADGDAVLGRIATGCIELLAGPQREALRRCEGPGCSLLFVKNHARRRWCHASCGHRDRQARYYRRVTSGAS